MIHERKLDKQLHINGPLTTCVATVTAALHEIEASIAIQNEGFENLIRGSKVTMEEVLSRAPGNWYIEANEAKSLGLVEGVLYGWIVSIFPYERTDALDLGHYVGADGGAPRQSHRRRHDGNVKQPGRRALPGRVLGPCR